MTSYPGREPGLTASEPQLPSIEELTVEPPGPGRSPGELSAIMRHSMGLAGAPPCQCDPDAPDVPDLREELGRWRIGFRRSSGCGV